MSHERHTPEQIIGRLPFSFAQGGQPAKPLEPTVFRIDIEGLCLHGTLNEYALSRNYRPAKEITGTLLPRFPHVPASGAQLTTWLNDLFSSPRPTVRAGPAAATAANL